MKDISVNYTIGNEVKQITLKFTTNGVVQIIMDKYYHGQAVFAQNEWRVYPVIKSELNNADDIQALIQILSDSI